ncbi:integrase catalytic domain-containing protein [Trichonephila clavipes]|uniref:Integrase catalytic domain-containing protein n=1 Tax=Trichonephila clavipes TaxID=2585209 RepID=A0A8X6VPD7_TRICX|nr:integrase catalytic domain-containing protein [Trichonephila clavipes]
MVLSKTYGIKVVLSSEQKLHYLKAAPTSEAKNLETISDSFESLFKSLEERVWGFRHNTLLHRQKGESANAPLIYSASPLQGQELNPNTEEFHSSQENTTESLYCTSRSKTVIIPTAVVWVLNHSTGSCIQARAVLDSGSMSNIVTSDFANRLGASQNRVNFPISCLDGNKTIVTQELAHPNFGFPGKIDLLIRAEAFFDIIKEGIIRTSDNALVFRSSVFGYIATGAPHAYKQNQYCGFISEMQNIDDNLQKFWEIETINEGQKPLNKEQECCDNHYQMTHTRNEAGRYVVQIPFKDIQGLGHSKGLAMKRLDQLWKRLSKDK